MHGRTATGAHVLMDNEVTVLANSFCRGCQSIDTGHSNLHSPASARHGHHAHEMAMASVYCTKIMVSIVDVC